MCSKHALESDSPVLLHMINLAGNTCRGTRYPTLAPCERPPALTSFAVRFSRHLSQIARHISTIVCM